MRVFIRHNKFCESLLSIVTVTAICVREQYSYTPLNITPKPLTELPSLEETLVEELQ